MEKDYDVDLFDAGRGPFLAQKTACNLPQCIGADDHAFLSDVFYQNFLDTI